MATLTTNYSFSKPSVGGDTDLWGGYLNTNWDSVDSLLSGGTPVAGIDINSGAIDGTPIGATTPSTGVFSSLLVGADTVATLTATQTLTNKTLTAPLLSGTVSSAGVNEDITLDPNGSGWLLLNSANVRVEQNILHFGDADTMLQFQTDEINLQTGGSERLLVNNSGLLLGGSGAQVTTILDDDTMAADSATALTTQQSQKAYVDAAVAAISPGFTGGTRQTLNTKTQQDFSIPAGVTFIAVQLDGVSHDGTSDLLLQLGDAGGIEVTGYDGASHEAAVSATLFSTLAGFQLTETMNAGATAFTQAFLTLMDASTNTWLVSGNSAQIVSGAGRSTTFSGSKALSAALTTVRVTTVSGDTYDAGYANVLYR